MSKKAIKILGKNADTKIRYLVRWQDGSTSYEDLVNSDQEILQLIQKWEVEQIKRKQNKSGIKDQTIEISDNEDEDEKDDEISLVRQNDGQLEFLVYLKKERQQLWMNQKQLLEEKGQLLCEYLLKKVKYK